MFTIHTVHSPWDDSTKMSYSPERGGMITSLVLGGKEILYFDKDTFFDETKSVRGGIPVLFPNAGPLEKNDIYPELVQHGFARKKTWKDNTKDDTLSLSLVADNETKKLYPFDFEIHAESYFHKDGALFLSYHILNNETGQGLPIAFGLHPYFKVPQDKKNEIVFDCEEAAYIQKNFERWSRGGYISIDNPKIKDQSANLSIHIPELGMLVLDIPTNYQKIWIWSLPGEDFICIEPFMRDVNGLLDNPFILDAKSSLELSVLIHLNESPYGIMEI